MGVAGLWDILRPASKNRSLTELAITEGFIANPKGVRGFRVGIDASIWFFHAEYGREGENPVLRTLFFRCATLMHAPFLPVFVFDGPRRPEVKRGKKINRQSNKLTPGMKSLVEAFGFEWRTAPAEAEAELAYLNRIGAIDGILSDDVDNFLFGATTVIRNPSNNLSGNRSNPALNANGKDDKVHTHVYRLSDITNHPDIGLTRGGLILIGLLSGGDYEQGGVSGVGPTIAHGLAKCGFGDSLLEATQEMGREELQNFLVAWRHDLCHELRTNSQGKIGRKCAAVAKKIPPNFPDIDILLSYTNPITSETEGRPFKQSDLTWSKEPNIGSLAGLCELYFEWGYREAIIKRFRTVIWHGAVLRILRRGVLDLDQKKARIGGTSTVPSTPRKAGKNGPKPFGTPSKLITKHFSSLAVPSSAVDSDDDDDGERLIIKIHSKRTHVSTDGTLEYRLEIAPGQLVRIAESELRGLRQPIGPDDWEEDEDEEGGGKKTKKPPPEPTSTLRVWMPACMVEIAEPHIVEDFREVERKKEEKKANKGKGRGKKKAAVVEEDDDDDGESTKENTPRKKAASSKNTGANRSTKAKAPVLADISDEESDVESPVEVIHDLTKKKAPSTNNGSGLKTFFKTTKPTTNVGKKAAQAVAKPKVTAMPAFTPDSPLEVDYADFLTSSRDNAGPSSSGSVTFTRDFTKKKATGSKSFNSLLQDKSTRTATTVKQTATSGSSTLQLVEEELDFFSKASSSSQVPSAQSTYIRSSKTISATLLETDSFLYDSDEPSLGAPAAPTAPSGSRKHTRERTITPSSSETSLGTHIHKSPKQSPLHTSPRRSAGEPIHRMGKSRIRSSSPTPVQRNQPPASPPHPFKSKPAHAAPVIELSDSESDSDLPPPKAAFAPLLAARARAQARSAEPSHKSKKQSDAPRPSIPVAKAQQPPIHDIIDLT